MFSNVSRALPQTARLPLSAALVLALGSSTALAELPTLPASFDVQKVAAADVLNIRNEPSAKGEIIGEIDPKATSVEVLSLSEDGKWGRIGNGEGNGWVSMNFLKASAVGSADSIPRPITCFGTEPFWNIALKADGAEFNSPETVESGAVPMKILEERVAHQGYLLRLEQGEETHTLVINRQSCSDGMSDREYGFSMKKFSTSGEGNMVVNGCCSLDNR